MSSDDLQPGSPEWLLAHRAPAAAPVRSDAGWKIGTFVFGAATIVLAILLAGQLAVPRYPYTPVGEPTSAVSNSPAPAPTETAAISDVSAQVGALGLVIMQNYSAQAGWPADVTLDNGTAVTAEGIVLGAVPDGWTLTYVVAADGSGFTLTLEDKAGQSAVFGPAAIDP